MKIVKNTHRLILVCCAQREAGGVNACGLKGRQVLLKIQAKLDNGFSGRQFRVLPVACLGFCSEGGVTVLDSSTDRIWIDVKDEDIDKLVGEIWDFQDEEKTVWKA